MSSAHPPLTAKDVRRGLKELGFEQRKQKSGTSHVHWVKIKDGRLYKVTLDAPKEPFTGDLVTSMANQAGVTKEKFYSACLKKK